MIDRRDLLKIGAAMPIALGVHSAVRAATGQSDLWVQDSRYARATPSTPHARTQTLLIDGDVTALWTDRLALDWRKPGMTVAGATGADALFVLEQLAWQHGRRVSHRQEIAPRTDSRPALIHWVIAPHHPSVQV